MGKVQTTTTAIFKLCDGGYVGRLDPINLSAVLVELMISLKNIIIGHLLLSSRKSKAWYQLPQCPTIKKRAIVAIIGRETGIMILTSICISLAPSNNADSSRLA
jgi:hypothetical protein